MTTIDLSDRVNRFEDRLDDMDDDEMAAQFGDLLDLAVDSDHSLVRLLARIDDDGAITEATLFDGTPSPAERTAIDHDVSLVVRAVAFRANDASARSHLRDMLCGRAQFIARRERARGN